MKIVFALLTCAFIPTNTFGLNSVSLEGKSYLQLSTEENNEGSDDWNYSYLVPILYRMYVKCTGVLISQFHILVAPQCFYYYSEGNRIISIRWHYACLASSSLGENYKNYDIKALDYHPNFDITENETLKSTINDIGIALLRRNDESKFKVMEALLAKSPLGEKSKPELVGYRSAGSSKLFEKPLMKFLDIVTVGKSECKRTFEGIFKLQENQICTHKTCKTNIVPKIGDVLVDLHRVVGLLTFTSGAESSHAVYTDVSEYSEYIEQAKERLQNPKSFKNIVVC